MIGGAWCANWASAQFYQQRSQAPRAPIPEVHHITVTRVAPSSPTPSAPKPSSPSGQTAPSGTQHHHASSRCDFASMPWLFWGTGYPVIWSGAYVPVFAPVAPAAGFGVMPVNNVPVPAPRPADVLNQRPAPPKVEGKPTNAAGKARSGKFISYGDANFGKQKYLAALDRYKTAAETADDLAEPVFRQGFALVALGQYASAAKAFRRALRIESDWSAPPFQLTDLYGNDRLAKTAHEEGLAKAVEANPFDSELLLALAMVLYFDGHAERAGVFFGRAAQLGGNEDGLLDSFLPRPAPADAPRQENPRGGKVVF
jgi:hypothetical protein